MMPLTPADVDTLRAALRVAIRTDITTLRHERPHAPAGAIRQAEARIRAFQQLADRLSPSTPPALPMDSGLAYARTATGLSPEPDAVSAYAYARGIPRDVAAARMKHEATGLNPDDDRR